MIDRAIFGDMDFRLDELEVEVYQPQVPCYICRRAEPDDPACNLVTLDGERRGLCRRCWENSEELTVPVSYMSDEDDDA